MAYTQQQLDTLTDAIAQGALEVWYGDKKVVYRSLKDMRSIKDEMKAELGLSKNNKRRFASFTKGTC
jgi:hypothetical protein